ncbi:hypothetical protein SKAU_G00025370 [Synaphobranchus kaupii]|uniref:Uncharacterized protein n=1 Tax=Synaphobranchus kaupii TaxID=118154 RepID=A0A9Q1GDZ8_SYNKA|nr:hypothetical protein SKAU_G00025370 [Synaphobranchus kaupii]
MKGEESERRSARARGREPGGGRKGGKAQAPGLCGAGLWKAGLPWLRLPRRAPPPSTRTPPLHPAGFTRRRTQGRNERREFIGEKRVHENHGCLSF